MHSLIRIFSTKIAGVVPTAAILTAAVLLLPRLSTLDPQWRELFPHLPLPVIIAGMLLSFQFRRGRVFLALILMTALHLASRAYLDGCGQASPPQAALGLLGAIIPFNITLFMFMRERGVLTVAGRMRLGFLALQALALLLLIRHQPDRLADFFGEKLSITALADGIPLPVPVLAVLLPSFLVSAVRLLFRPSPVNAALLGGMAATAAASACPALPDLPALFITASSLALAIGVLQDSHDMAFRDDLTSLPSRRALNDRLSDMGRRYVIAMLDVDHFKGFNDAYGHDVGDQVLRMVARRIDAVKGGGRAYRYGGEEFIVVFPRKRLEEAIPHLEEVRRSIEEYRLVLRDSSRPEKSKIGRRLRGSGEGETVSVTISIGVAESGNGMTPLDVLKEADQALYRAKRKGRNILSK